MMQKILVKNVNIVDVAIGSIQREMDILIGKDRIQSIYPSNKVETADAFIVDCTGKYAVPGLFESHAHLSHLKEMEKDERGNILKGFVKKGIMQVRDVGGPVDILMDMKEQIQKGNTCGPDIFYSGPMLEKSPLYWRKINESMPGFTVAVDTKEDADRIISGILEKGASLVKTFGKFDLPVFEYLLEKAGENSLPVTHDPGAPLFNMVPMDIAMDLGIRCIEHGKAPWPCVLKDSLQKQHDELCRNYNHEPGADEEFAQKVFSMGSDSISEEKLDRLACRMVENNTFFCPTLRVFNERAMEPGEEYSRLIKILDSISLFCTGKMIKNGVPLLVGIDSCMPDTHDEIKLLKDTGLSDLEILRGATIYPAKWLNMLGDYGSVAQNSKANLFITEKDPLEDIRNLMDIYISIKDGRVIN